LLSRFQIKILIGLKFLHWFYLIELFHSGVDFVFAPIGVVADACHVVSA
jgi:hypothetical protein